MNGFEGFYFVENANNDYIVFIVCPLINGWYKYDRQKNRLNKNCKE